MLTHQLIHVMACQAEPSTGFLRREEPCASAFSPGAAPDKLGHPFLIRAKTVCNGIGKMNINVHGACPTVLVPLVDG